MYYAHQQLKTILAYVPFGVIVVKTDRRIQWANRAALRLLNLSNVDELLGRRCCQHIRLDQRKRCAVWHYGEHIADSEQTLLGNDGTKIPVFVTVETMPLDGEEVLVATFVDISPNKGAQSKLIDPQQNAAREGLKLRSTIEAMEEGVVLANADNMVTNVNQWLLEKVGVSENQVFGRSIWELHARSEAGENLKDIVERFRCGERNEPYVIQQRLMGMHFSLRVQPIFHDECYQQCILDEIDASSLVKPRQAGEAGHTKSLFLANMSHEIRNRLTAILGFSDTLLEYIDHPQGQDAARTIKRNGEHLLAILNDTLDISKLEIGQSDLEMVRQSPHEIVAEVLSLFKARANAKGLMLTDEYVGRMPETIVTDPIRLRQILVNLTDNAVKFTDTGTVCVVTRLIQSPQSDPKLQFDVVDTGIGMADEQVDIMFEAFIQGDESKRRQIEGTGLGLSISRRLARLLGGDLTAKSSPGKGSAFTLTVATGALDGVRLIKYGTGMSPTGKDTAEPRDELEEIPGCRVLLAEDNLDNQRLFSTILRKAGIEVTIAQNGQEAMDKAWGAYPELEEGRPRQASHFDVILMNMTMPVLDGHEATRRLRRNGYRGPIVALTAHAMRGDRQDCIDAGCDDYLSKPIDRKKLLETLARWGAN